MRSRQMHLLLFSIVFKQNSWSLFLSLSSYKLVRKKIILNMDEFPDPDEEYEMRFADEFELMNELG